MNRKMILLAILVLALVSLACSININLGTQNKTGPTVTEDISVPYLSDPQAIADLTLQFGAGKLNLQPGAQDKLVSGTAKFNVADLKPTVTIDSNNINIDQGSVKLNGIPYVNQNVINEWDLSLGNKPISLAVKAGAYTGNYELGGLSLHRLDVTDGASNVDMSFSKPNLIDMVSFNYTTGASDVTIKGIGNANPDEMIFHSGAGSYTLDFSGTLKRDMTVKVESGVSTVKIIVPQGVAANLVNDSSLVTVTSAGGWEQQGDNYWLSASGPTITIEVKMGAGTLQLETAAPGD